jgi:hypothetical protein
VTERLLFPGKSKCFSKNFSLKALRNKNIFPQIYFYKNIICKAVCQRRSRERHFNKSCFKETWNFTSQQTQHKNNRIFLKISQKIRCQHQTTKTINIVIIKLQSYYKITPNILGTMVTTEWFFESGSELEKQYFGQSDS